MLIVNKIFPEIQFQINQSNHGNVMLRYCIETSGYLARDEYP